MKTETLRKGQELESSIHSLEQSIYKLENDKGCTPTLNFLLYYDKDKEEIRKAVLRMMKRKLTQYKKEFDILK